MAMSFRWKVSFLFIILSLVVSLFSLYWMYSNTITSQMKDFQASLLMTATLGAELIDGDAHKQITPDRASINTTYYQHIKRRLQFIQEANPKIRYVYTVGKSADEKRLFFMVDSASSEDIFSYPGDSYESLSDKDVRAAFLRPQVNAALIHDTWGSYMSGYAPIRDAQGVTVAVLGLDMSGETIEATQNAVKQNLIIIFLMSVVVASILGVSLANRLAQPINTLVEGTERIAHGDFNCVVAVNTNDELGKLARSFNRMSVSLQESNRKLRKSFLDTIRALTTALEAKDPYTRGHSERVMKYGVAIARELGVPEDEIENLQYLYIMHDIGKIAVDDSILNKPTELSEEEKKRISEHAVIGGEILAPISFLNEQLMQIVRSHHERQDGTGYPQGLKEDQIPLSVAILTVADAYDAMVTNRPYRKGISREAACAELKKNAGPQFRKDVVEAFFRVLERGTHGVSDAQ